LTPTTFTGSPVVTGGHDVKDAGGGDQTEERPTPARFDYGRALTSKYRRAAADWFS
jgi:hypothetical protein